MEHLVVHYDRRRGVLLDGNPSGFTNQDIRSAEGTYTVTLAGDSNYAPASRRVTLRGTTVLAPRVIRFARKK